MPLTPQTKAIVLEALRDHPAGRAFYRTSARLAGFLDREMDEPDPQNSDKTRRQVLAAATAAYDAVLKAIVEVECA